LPKVKQTVLSVNLIVFIFLLYVNLNLHVEYIVEKLLK